MIRLAGVIAVALLVLPAASPTAAVPGLTAAAVVVRTYDTILDAQFASLARNLAETCGPAPPEACQVIGAVGLLWEIALEPESRLHDARFSRVVDEAIAVTDAWTQREPGRAEAWFYLGAAYGARVQWRVTREQRLAAARDGKRIKETLERALTLDPSMHDAKFGVGLYRYYADVAPAALRLLRWLLLLPGGDREGGLRQMYEARDRGVVVGGEVDYQLHLIYLWYERRARDALAIIRQLQTRYPHNPLFVQIEAEIHDAYLHDAAASLAASSRLLALADAGQVGEAGLASVRARLNMAVQLDRLGQRSRALDLLDALIAERPTRPRGATTYAESLRTILRRKR